jgi:chromosome partitioning protein
MTMSVIQHFDISVKELSDIFNISVQAMHKFIKEQKIKLTKIGNSYKILPQNFNDILKAKNITKKKMVISTCCVKGGVGKTTLTHALASKSACYGHRTLMIDLDQQANLTTSFGVDSTMVDYPTLLDVYRGYFNGKNIAAEDILVHLNSHLSIIPSNLKMAAFESEFSSRTENIANFFSKLLAPIKNQYDLIWFDCPPALGKITSASQAFSDLVLVPINTDKFSMDGLELTIDSILSLNEKFAVNPDLKIVINKFDARQKLGFQIINMLSDNCYNAYLSDTFISTSKQIDNCIAQKRNIWDSKFKSAAQDNLRNLTQQILETDKWNNKDKPKSKIPKEKETKIDEQIYLRKTTQNLGKQIELENR